MGTTVCQRTSLSASPCAQRIDPVLPVGHAALQCRLDRCDFVCDRISLPPLIASEHSGGCFVKIIQRREHLVVLFLTQRVVLVRMALRSIAW